MTSAAKGVVFLIFIGGAWYAYTKAEENTETKKQAAAAEAAAESAREAELLVADKAAPPIQLPKLPIRARDVITKNRNVAAAALGVTNVKSTDPEITADIEGTHFVTRFKNDVANELSVTPTNFRRHRDGTLLLQFLDVGLGQKVNGHAIRIVPNPTGVTIIDDEEASKAKAALVAKAAAEAAKQKKLQDAAAAKAKKFGTTCAERGVAYYKEVGIYPKLSDGRFVNDVVIDRCSRSSIAFDFMAK